MRGDATLFTRRDEVEAEWRIITPIEEAWAHLPAPDFPNYAAGSEGPASWHELLNDTVGGQPVAVTYSALCGSGILWSTKNPAIPTCPTTSYPS